MNDSLSPGSRSLCGFEAPPPRGAKRPALSWPSIGGSHVLGRLFPGLLDRVDTAVTDAVGAHRHVGGVASWTGPEAVFPGLFAPCVIGSPRAAAPNPPGS